MSDAQYWINRLQLKRHPEGGYFRETYRAAETIEAKSLPERFKENRAFATAIYFLLTADEFSAFHCMKSDETWHFYTGSPLKLHVLTPRNNYYTRILGKDIDQPSFQETVPAGAWLAAEVIAKNAPRTFTLVGCTVAPGFEFEDFQLADKQYLISKYPQHRELIESFTRT